MERKLQHRWSILCRESSIDSQTNNLSLFNVLEQVKIDIEVLSGGKRRAVPMNLELITLWEKKDEAGEVHAEIEVEFQDPDGKSLAKFPYSVVVPKRRHRHFVKLNGLPVGENSGRYTFKIRKKEEGEDRFAEAGEAPLEINVDYILSKQKKELRRNQ